MVVFAETEEGMISGLEDWINDWGKNRGQNILKDKAFLVTNWAFNPGGRFGVTNGL